MTRRKAFFRLWPFFAVLFFLLRNVAAIADGTIADLYSGLLSRESAAILGSLAGFLVGYGAVSGFFAALACLAVKNPPKAD